MARPARTANFDVIEHIRDDLSMNGQREAVIQNRGGNTQY